MIVRWPKWVAIFLLVVIASNAQVSAASTADKSIMQARNWQWFGAVYVAQMYAHVEYDNGLGQWIGGTWYWLRYPKVWTPGSFIDCHMDGIVHQTLTGAGCGATRISRRTVEVFMVWRQEIKVLGVGMERTCWMRARISTPDAIIHYRRWGGDC